MIILVGASASGKTEIARMLFDIYGYHKCITTTTRPPRAYETNGVDYHFMTDEAFNQAILKGAFVEHAQYQGHQYGLQKKDVNTRGVVILEPNGANAVMQHMKDDVFVVYVHASIETRKDRMTKRQDHPQKIENRLKSDEITFKTSHLKHIDLIIENDSGGLEPKAKKIHASYMHFLNHTTSTKVQKS